MSSWNSSTVTSSNRFVMVVLGFNAVPYEHTRRSNKKWNTNRMLSLRGSDIGTSALFDELERAAVIVCSCMRSCLRATITLSLLQNEVWCKPGIFFTTLWWSWLANISSFESKHLKDCYAIKLKSGILLQISLL